jgi:hypothetical protein
VEVVAREDGRFQVEGRVFARAEGFPQFGLPGWRIPLRIKTVTLSQHYETWGSKNGDLRPPLAQPRLGCSAQINGFNNRIGILGLPETEATELSVSIYPYDEASLGNSEFETRCRTSWPTSLLLTNGTADSLPWNLTAHIPRHIFQEIVAAASAGRLEELGLDATINGFYVIDHERPNGQENGWVAYLPPADERGWLTPLLGYISGLVINHRLVRLSSGINDEAAPESVPETAALPLAPPKPRRGKTAQTIIFWILFALALAIGTAWFRH